MSSNVFECPVGYVVRFTDRGSSVLNDQELEAYFEKHGLIASAREYIRYARTSDPSRLVGANGGPNLVSAYPSRKMGRSIQTESRTFENMHAVRLEYDDSVFEFWDQLPAIPVDRTGRNGKKRAGSYKADFLVLTTEGPEIHGVKPAKKIEQYLKQLSDDWILENGTPVYLPSFLAFKALGLRHRVVSSAEINPILVTNLRLLLQSRAIPQESTHMLRDRVVSAMSRHAWCRLSELAAELKIEDLTPLLQLVDRNVLHASLTDEFLAQPQAVWIASSPAALAQRKELDGTENLLLPKPGDSTALGREFVPTKNQAARALDILERIDRGERGRTLRRHLKKLKKAAAGESRFQIVVPKYHLRGNRTPRLHPLCEETLKVFIETEFATSKRLSKRQGHALYKNIAKDKHPHLSPVSLPTFYRYLRTSNQQETARGRGGLRAANAAAPPVNVEDRLLPALRPLERGTMDHHEANLYCVLASRGGVNYRARPWISALIDCHDDMILAIWVSFLAPSTRSCSMLLRRCVRQHGRLPEEVIMDWGPEFRSVFVRALLAYYGVQHTLRPKSHPRFGSEVERFFKIFQELWLNLLPGNFAEYHESRAVSASHAAYNNAVLTVDQFLTMLLAFVDWYNANRIGVDALSPLERHNEGIRLFSCSGKRIHYDESFIIKSAIHAKEPYTVDPARGIHVGDLHYWHPALTKVARQRTPVVDVKIEPEDPYRLYALVDHQWVTALASGAQPFSALDPVSQLSKAIRILDGASARLEAKQDAEQILITGVREFEKSRMAAASPQPAALTENKSAPDPKSIFAELRSTNVVPLNTTKWRS